MAQQTVVIPADLTRWYLAAAELSEFVEYLQPAIQHTWVWLMQRSNTTQDQTTLLQELHEVISGFLTEAAMEANTREEEVKAAWIWLHVMFTHLLGGPENETHPLAEQYMQLFDPDYDPDKEAGG